ncbi:MAG: SurA N-terminal domain-containing protein [Acidobacteria bacterium]|nr:SurA N-terminal domain-containing protein [Acidobacteriota bacterium]
MARLALAVTVSLMLAGGEGWAQQGASTVYNPPSTPHQSGAGSAIRHPQPGGPPSAIRHPPSASAGVIIDRLVAVVNDSPTTESDLLWFLALDAEVPAGQFTNELKRLALGQVIDQELLYQEAQKLPAIEVSQEEISQYIADLIRRFPSEPAFRHRLEAVGFDGATLQETVRRRLIILQFIEFRFRSFVFATEEEIQSYYQSRVVPLARERGETPPPFEQIRNVIERTIIEDKVASELSNWFEEARRRSEIVRLVEY